MNFAIILIALGLSACAGVFLSRVSFAEHLRVRTLFLLFIAFSAPFVLLRALVLECSHYYNLPFQIPIPDSIGSIFGFYFSILNSTIIPLILIVFLTFIFSSLYRFIHKKPWRVHYDIAVTLFAGVIPLWAIMNSMSSSCGLRENRITLTFAEYSGLILKQTLEQALILVPIVAILFFLLSSNSFTINHWKRRGIALLVLLLFYGLTQVPHGTFSSQNTNQIPVAPIQFDEPLDNDLLNQERSPAVIREQLSVNAYREGLTIYSTYYSEARPQVLFTSIDLATFKRESELTIGRTYGPVRDGGFAPHWYTDINYLYCGISGKGAPMAVRLAQPVELAFIPLVPAFDPSDGFSETELSAWQERSTGEYGQLYWLQTETGQYYSVMDCAAVVL